MTGGIWAEDSNQCSSARIYPSEACALASDQAYFEIVPDLSPTAFVSPATSLEERFQKQFQSPMEVLKDMLVTESAKRKIASRCTDAEACAHVTEVRHVI
ncbi:hypothetical protein EAH87_06360 [Sphingomonas koreensis]|nr:hypothetical protein EAH87_06360 [Sphingomonas koreensis]